jgi:hypothetical protein
MGRISAVRCKSENLPVVSWMDNGVLAIWNIASFSLPVDAGVAGAKDF